MHEKSLYIKHLSRPRYGSTDFSRITASIFNRKGLTGNRYLLIAIGTPSLLQLGFTYLAPMQALFGTTAIEFGEWLIILLVASSVLFLVELEKYIVRQLEQRRENYGADSTDST